MKLTTYRSLMNAERFTSVLNLTRKDADALRHDGMLSMLKETPDSSVLYVYQSPMRGVVSLFSLQHSQMREHGFINVLDFEYMREVIRAGKIIDTASVNSVLSRNPRVAGHTPTGTIKLVEDE